MVKTKKEKTTGRYVDAQYVDTMIRTYKKERWVHNSERIGKEDSLTAWVNLEQLEEFVEQIKMHGGNGIRICFGAHPMDFENQDLAGRQTVVMVATKGTESKTNKDLYVSVDGKANLLAQGWYPVCPPWCGGGFTNPGTTIIDNGEKGMTVV
ncbi:MAG TPA: hypothetical protein VKR32_03580 [Puia sp.]|nr:hypothetical protein [Puia sp.]